MTLNENHIRELLEQATPGPWVTVGECFIDKDGNERYSPELISSRADGIGRDVMWNTDEAVSWCSNSHDPQLAALAPELARDWLRMRDHLDPVELTTEADFENAPEGTIVARNEEHPFVKNGPGGWWDTYSNMFDETELAGTSRKVLRWGWGE